MRKIVIVFTLIMISMSARSQALLHGMVLEYEGSETKKPLGGVELVIQDAGTTVSAIDGSFVLSFRTKQRGDAVKVIRIEKLNYEIFNTDAVSQWNIGDEFTIVMCSSARFKSLRDNYFKVSSKSYAKQYEKEQKKLAKMRKTNKLKETEYQAKLKKLKNDYEEQLEQLDSYVDRFARIDLSELSSVERRIIELVQQGKIEQAIEEYEKQNYLGKYKQQTHEIHNIDSAIVRIDDLMRFKIYSRDSIYKALNRQINLYQQVGGEDNLSKVGELLKSAADADTTNLVAVLKYAEYAESYIGRKEALPYYHVVLDLVQDDKTMQKIIKEKINNLKKEDDE